MDIQPRISFVILHYENLDDTKHCVDSLLDILRPEHDCSVIIVDNGSSKGKTEAIKNDYKKYSNVYFLRSEVNGGFARGNNMGFKFAKYRMDSDIIVLSNNDIVFEQRDFIEKLTEQYKFSDFDVAGPRIISLADGKNQNPVPILYPSIESVNIRIFKYYILYFMSFLNIDLFAKKIFAHEIKEYSPDTHADFQLHGAFMMFGKNYIKKFDGLCDRTFMYGEESILKTVCKKYKLRMCYFSELCVYHKEGASTNAVYKKNKDKRQFYYKWNINSCKILREIMRGTVDA